MGHGSSSGASGTIPGASSLSSLPLSSDEPELSELLSAHAACAHGAATPSATGASDPSASTPASGSHPRRTRSGIVAILIPSTGIRARGPSIPCPLWRIRRDRE